MAGAFALSFIVLGVGSGSTGIGQVIDSFFSGSSASGSSLSSLEHQTVLHPKSATAWLNYANQLEDDHQDDEAIAALTQYTKLRPSDQNELLELAGLDYERAVAWDTLYSETQSLEQAIDPSSAISPASTSPLGKALAALPTDPTSQAVSTEVGGDASSEYSKLVGYLSNRVTVYQKIVALTPGNAVNEYSLGQAAYQAAEVPVAIAAYKKFLKLAPDNSLAADARQAIATLKGAAAG